MAIDTQELRQTVIDRHHSGSISRSLYDQILAVLNENERLRTESEQLSRADGLAIAKARDAWFDSEEGARCASAYTLPKDATADKYLRNRLEAAFIAGASILTTRAPIAAPVPDAAKLLSAFPLFDDEGLNENEHCCEWTLQQDRKRLHAMLSATPQSAPVQAAAPVPEIDSLELNEMAWRFIEAFPEGALRKELLASHFVKHGLRAAMLASHATGEQVQREPVAQLAYHESNRDPRDGPRLISWNDLPRGTYPVFLDASHEAKNIYRNQRDALRAENDQLLARVGGLEKLLTEAGATLEAWADVAPAVSLRADIAAAIAQSQREESNA